MTRIRKKEYIDENVWEASLRRIRELYKRFDRVVVSFSGGKDSTAALHATLEVAKELDRLPLEVVFFDEEAIHPPTIEYVRRVYNRPDIDMRWYCLEFKHRNACSNEEPWWYCWEKGKEDLWVRPMPEEAITEHPRFKKGMSFQDFCPMLDPPSLGRTALIMGLRTQESINRYRIVAQKASDHFVASKSMDRSNQYRAWPLYDWSSTDVWVGVRKFGWDYNRTYDYFNKTDMYNHLLRQRVCPPYGEEPLRGLYIYAECFPEMWHAMTKRVKGVGAAWRYANTDLYSNSGKKPPEGVKWKDYMEVIVDSYEGEIKRQVKVNINEIIKIHTYKTDDPIREYPHPLSGVSYRFLCRIALRGNMKGRANNLLPTEAEKQRKKMNITYEQAKKRYGKVTKTPSKRRRMGSQVRTKGK